MMNWFTKKEEQPRKKEESVVFTVFSPGGGVEQVIDSRQLAVKHYSFVRSMVLIEFANGTNVYLPQALTAIVDTRVEKYK